jgi:CBS domain containing-hemolysin-like protein
MLTDLLYVALGLVLTAGTAVFVAAEFSLVALESAQVEAAARRGQADASPRRARSILTALRHLSTNLSGAQVGITLTTVLLGFTTQPALARLFARLFSTSDGAGGAGATLALAGACSVIAVNAVSMVGGELAPKNLALSEPLKAAARVAGPLRWFTTVARPFIWLLQACANGLLRLFGVRPTEELSGVRTAPELASLVRRSAAEGTLAPLLASRLTRSLNWRDLRTIDVMTDRTRMVAVDRSETAAGVIAAAEASGHSTYPVIEGGDRDEVDGIVRLRRAVAVPYERRAEVPVSALMEPAPRVPETAPVGPVLVELRAAGVPMAVVVDEYGGTSGVLTIEDLVEEIVGEVRDEHDPRQVRPRRLADGSWLVPGRLRPDELRDLTGVRVPEDPSYETLGGLVMRALERVPAVGEEAVVPGARLRVEAMTARRVDSLRVWGARGQTSPRRGAA